jgi:hypothetical protein
MGFYSDGTIFGIKLFSISDDCVNILYEKLYQEIMTDEQKQYVYNFCQSLPKNIMNKLEIRIYTNCQDTYESCNNVVYKMWYPINLDDFLQEFNTLKNE